mmetsp:Transcript_45759/g.133238  ORF Transcript_45759/g.133238 Transcript_45759/m.133238 type:complete len:235 (+) Transcript_45759:212-916(+)
MVHASDRRLSRCGAVLQRVHVDLLLTVGGRLPHPGNDLIGANLLHLGLGDLLQLLLDDSDEFVEESIILDMGVHRIGHHAVLTSVLDRLRGPRLYFGLDFILDQPNHFVGDNVGALRKLLARKALPVLADDPHLDARRALEHLDGHSRQDLRVARLVSPGTEGNLRDVVVGCDALARPVNHESAPRAHSVHAITAAKPIAVKLHAVDHDLDSEIVGASVLCDLTTLHDGFRLFV